MIVERIRRISTQLQSASTDSLETERVITFGQSAPQGQEAGLEIVVPCRESDRPIESDLLVRELGSSRLRVLGEEGEPDSAWNALDHIGTIDEHRSIVLVEGHRSVDVTSERRSGIVNATKGVESPCLEEGDCHGQMPSDDLHDLGCIFVEPTRLLTVEIENSEETVVEDQRRHQDALGISEAGERNLLPLVVARLLGCGQRAPTRHVRNPYLLAPMSADSDRSRIHGDLGANAGYGVSVAGHDEEALCRMVGHEQHGVCETEHVLDRLESDTGCLSEVATLSEAANEHIQPTEGGSTG